MPQQLQQHQQPLLLPRPETLAVLPNDVFSEKLVTSSSRHSSINKIVNDACVHTNESSTKNDEKEVKAEVTIPFIDDEFEDLSYVLHRRQFGGDKENKVPIKEETIFIKSSLRNSFMQKFATPLRRSFSRKNSQKSLNKNETNSSINKNKVEIMPYEKALINNNNNNRESSKNAASDLDKTQLNDAKLNQPDASMTNIPVSNPIKTNNDNIIASNTTNTNAHFNSNNTNNKNNTNNILDKQISIPCRQISNPPVNNNKSKGKHENRARKALRTISFILGAFIFCFAPWHVVVIVNSFCTNCWKYTIYHHFYYSCYFLCYMNSPINPFMYALANQQFSKTFFRILKGDLRRL